MKGYRKLRSEVLTKLSEGLSPDLTYHGFHHTLDVMEVCNKYIRRSGLKGREAHLLRIGAMSHDIGFLYTYRKHEEKGVEVMTDMMARHGFSDLDIGVVAGLIMATKVPQRPSNELEKIICDADLDYLGRDDFEPISESLFEELQNYGIVEDRDKWNCIQLDFLTKHQYHTDYAKKYRKPEKDKRLDELRALCGAQ